MSERWQIWRRDQGTGELIQQVGMDRTARQAASLLSTWTGYEPDQLAGYAVVAHTGFVVDGESWLEEHPIDALLAAWNAGSPAASGARQKQLHEWWPALAKAIDNVETNHNAGAVTKAGPGA